MDRIIGATPRTRPLPTLSSGKLTLHSLVLQHVTLQASAPDPNSSLQDLGSSPHRKLENGLAHPLENLILPLAAFTT